MEKKQSSIDYLFERFYANEGMIKTKQLEQAKAMHKEELFETFKAGQDSTEEGGKGFDQWYNLTYGGNK